MPSGARRLHRLPQPLDQNLIPAPLDLSLPRVTEKSPLPAIIVTPSSPSLGAPEYYIAFLTPPPKPTLRERITQLSLFQGQFPLKARTALLISLLLFIVVCHLLAHLAAHRRRFDLNSSHIPPHSESHVSSLRSFMSLGLQSFWGTAASEDRINYIVEELSQPTYR